MTKQVLDSAKEIRELIKQYPVDSPEVKGAIERLVENSHPDMRSLHLAQSAIDLHFSLGRHISHLYDNDGYIEPETWTTILEGLVQLSSQVLELKTLFDTPETHEQVV